MFTQLTQFFTPPKAKNVVRSLIKQEAKIGGQLFGHVPKGHRRDFFCLDSKTWVWYEGWTDANGQEQSVTTRYEIRPTGVVKVQDGQQYHYVRGQELQNLLQAARVYYQRVTEEVYHRQPAI